MNNLKLTLKVCFLVVIEALFCFTPLGSIPIGPIVATLAMIPVIIASLTFGKKIGMLMGFIMAIFSFIVWTFIMPANPSAFLFTPFSEFVGYKGNFFSLIICFVPRILTGLVPALVMGASKSVGAKGIVGASTASLKAVGAKGNVGASTVSPKQLLAAAFGSLTNTILVMLFIFLFFRNQYETLVGQNILTVIGLTILTNGVPEAIIAAIVCPAVSNAIRNEQ